MQETMFDFSATPESRTPECGANSQEDITDVWAATTRCPATQVPTGSTEINQENVQDITKIQVSQCVLSRP